MKKVILIIFFIFIFFIISFSDKITANILLSFNICFNNLFPSLIPFMLISNILVKYNFIDDLNNIFSFFTKKIFKLNKNCGFAIAMSMISGTPSNSKYLKDLYNNSLISTKDINKCLNFCHFANPLFIIGTIGVSFFNNKKIGLIILISHYLSSFIIGIIFRKQKSNIIELDTELKIKKKNLISILNESIIETANTLLLILGIITFCLILTTIIDSLLNISNEHKYIYGLLEITQGLKFLSLSNLNINIKAVIASFIISFGGFCIHLQVFSILDNKKIRYIPYFMSRISHGIISSFLTYIIILLN